MKTLILNPGTKETDDTALASLSAGQFGILHEDGVNTQDTVPTAGTRFQIVYNKAALGGIIASPMLDLTYLTSVEQMDDAAGTAQVVYVTPILPTTQAKYDEYTLKIINTSPATANLKSKTFNVVNTTGTDYTVATLCDAFVALIGADTDVKVTVTDGTTHLILTADIDETFRVAVQGELEGSTITYQTAMIPSCGLYDQVAALEAECRSYDRGITNKVLHVVEPASEAASGSTYDITKLVFDMPSTDKTGRKNSVYERHEIYIVELTTNSRALGALFIS